MVLETVERVACMADPERAEVDYWQSNATSTEKVIGWDENPLF